MNFMQIANNEAESNILSKEGGPFGAVIVKNQEIIVIAHNQVLKNNDPTAHAEINLIRKACKDLNTKNLSNYVLISNAWSCSMCMSAAIKAKISNFIYGAKSENDMNPLITIFDIKEKTNNDLNIVTGILEEQCQKQIQDARKI